MTDTDRSALPLGMPATRKLSRQQLALAVLALLESGPLFGEQLADRLETLSYHFYRPSPGMLYPVLGELIDEDHVIQERQGRRKYNRLTARGRAALKRDREAAEHVLDRLQRTGRKVRAIETALSEQGEPAGNALPLATDMMTARMDMKAVLHESQQLPLSQQQIVLDLIRQFTNELRELLGRQNDPAD